MRKVAAVAVILGLLTLAPAAEAHVLPVGIAKREVRRATSELCAETSGCVNWKVGPCRRQSLHRVDCVSRLQGESGATCAFVTIAHVAPRSYEIKIHHKRIVCS